MKFFLQVLLFCGLALFSFGERESTVEPGMMSRCNQMGVQFTYQALLKNWKEALLNEAPRTFTSPFYSISLKATSIDFGTTRAETMAPNSLSYVFEGASATFHVTWNFFIGPNQYSGNNTMTIRDINLEQQFLFKIKENGLTGVLPGVCKADAGPFRFNLEDSEASTILLLQILRNNLNPASVQMICSQSSEAITRLIPSFLDLPGVTSVPINLFFPGTPDANIKMTLVDTPKMDDHSISFFVSGKAFSTIHDPRGKVDIERPAFPSSIPARQMAQLILGEYVINTWEHAQWQNGAYDRLENEKQKLDSRTVGLTTTKTGQVDRASDIFGIDMSIAGLISREPKFADYFDSTLEYNDTLLERPITKINATGMYRTARRMREMLAVFDNDTRVTLTSSVYTTEVHFQLYVFNEGLHRRIISHSATAVGDSGDDIAFNAFAAATIEASKSFFNNAFTQSPWVFLRTSMYNLAHLAATLMDGAVNLGCDLKLNN